MGRGLWMRRRGVYLCVLTSRCVDVLHLYYREEVKAQGKKNIGPTFATEKIPSLQWTGTDGHTAFVMAASAFSSQNHFVSF